MIIDYFHISIIFSYGEYLQSLLWPRYCIHKYDILTILENTSLCFLISFHMLFSLIRQIINLSKNCSQYAHITKQYWNIIKVLLCIGQLFLLNTCFSMCHVYLRPNITFYFELNDMKITGLIFSRQNIPVAVGDKKWQKYCTAFWIFEVK